MHLYNPTCTYTFFRVGDSRQEDGAGRGIPCPSGLPDRAWSRFALILPNLTLFSQPPSSHKNRKQKKSDDAVRVSHAYASSRKKCSFLPEPCLPCVCPGIASNNSRGSFPICPLQPLGYRNNGKHFHHNARGLSFPASMVLVDIDRAVLVH